MAGNYQSTLDYTQSFQQGLDAGLLHKRKSYGISGPILSLILSFLNNSLLQVVLDGKSSQEFPVNAGVPQDPLLVLHFSYYTIIAFLMMISVILLSKLIILLSILSMIRNLICGNIYRWLLNLNLIWETLWTGTGVAC